MTRSPAGTDTTRPDSEVAKAVTRDPYVSVPIVLAGHELYGMVCGARRLPQAVVGGPIIELDLAGLARAITRAFDALSSATVCARRSRTG